MSTRAQILAEIAAQFPDNTTGLITPAKLRQVVEDVTNSCLVSDTDAGTAGIAALQAETQAQLRTAAGFGGTVTVAQLAAAGDAAKSAMYYCSDCITVNGPGSLVAWCGRTSTWRTLDDCLLATTSFDAWVNDYIANSNLPEIRGSKGALWCLLDTSTLFSFTGANGAGTSTSADATLPEMHRRIVTSTTANGWSREHVTNGLRRPTGSAACFVGIRRLALSSVAAGFYVRIGLSSAANQTVSLNETAIVYDAGNVVGGLNPGLAAEWCACLRIDGTNGTGSGPVGVGASTDFSARQNLCLIRRETTATAYIDGALVASGNAEVQTSALTPFQVIANDGTTAPNITARHSGFCFGYLNP